MTTTKKSFALYTPSQNGHRSVEESIAEVQREMDTRKRILDRWVQEGKISWMDAHDRFERHLSALKHLIDYSNALDRMQAEHDNPTLQLPGTMPDVELDIEAAEQAA